MKKVFLSFLLYLIFNIVHSANKPIKTNYNPEVNIEILNIVTNGLKLPNNTFSFNGLDDLVIEFDVKTTYTGSNIDFNKGHINCSFYEPNSFDNETVENFNNGVNPILVFDEIITLEANNNNIYSYTFHKTLHFKRKTAYNTGCSLVFRYGTGWETNNPETLKKITYNFIGGTKTGNESNEPAIANINVNNFSDINELPLKNNTIIVPDIENEEIGTRGINLSLNYNCIFGSKLAHGYYPNVEIQIKDYMTEDEAAKIKAELQQLNIDTKNFDGTKTIAVISKWIYGNNTNGTFIFNDLKIKSSDLTNLSPKAYINILFRFQEININHKLATVRKSNPILYNYISDNQSITKGSLAKPFTSEQPMIWTSGGTCVRRGCNDPQIYTNITSFQWQKSNPGNNWTNITNATNKEYAESNILNLTTSYRRIAFFNDGYNISNTVTISLNNTPIQNNICCSQNLSTVNGQPSKFIGNIPNPIGPFSYQWQIAVSAYTPLVWTNINGAIDKDYLHIFTKPAQRGTGKTTFRRLIIQNNAVVNISNEIIVNRGNTAKIISEDNSKKEVAFTNNNIIIYPNPAKNVFYVELNHKNSKPDGIKLLNLAGIEFDINKTIISNSKIQIDCTNLPDGIYIIKIDDNLKKIIIKN